MDVACPISSVIPSLDGGVLGVLAGTTAPLNLSAVHRLCGRGSLSGVRRVLVRLTRTGLVEGVPGGYVLNRHHVAADAIEALAQLWGEVLDRIRSEVESWPDQPELVGLFGSAARRDGDEDSDMDLLIVSDTKAASDLAASLADKVHAWTGNATHIVALERADLRRMRRAGEEILTEWDRDIVAIVGSRDVLKASS